MNALTKFKKKHKLEDGKTAAEVGAAATLVPAAAFSIKHELADKAENAAVRRTRAFQDFQDKLQKGDILFHHRAVKKSPGIEPIGGIPIPGREADWMMASKGDHHYHSSIYEGKGKISEAADYEKGVRSDRPLSYEYGENVRAYRPKKSELIPDALAYTKSAHGTPYVEQEDLVKGAMEHLFAPGGGGNTTGKVPCKGSFCTQHVANAYPDVFDKLNVSPADMRHSKDLELIARYEPKAARTLRELALSRGAYPILKNLKYGLGAGAATYGAMKLNDYLDKD